MPTCSPSSKKPLTARCDEAPRPSLALPLSLPFSHHTQSRWHRRSPILSILCRIGAAWYIPPGATQRRRTAAISAGSSIAAGIGGDPTDAAVKLAKVLSLKKMCRSRGGEGVAAAREHVEPVGRSVVRFV